MLQTGRVSGINPRRVSDSEDDINSVISLDHLEPHAMEWTQKEYWLGQKYFAYVQAEHVLRTSQPEESLSELDSRLHAALREHPHEEHLKLLQDQISDGLFRDSSNDYEGLMTTIGSILHKGSAEEIRLLVLSLQKHQAERKSFEHSMTGTYPDALDHGEVVKEGVQAFDDWGRYMMALKEYSEQLGYRVGILIDPKGLDPPLFEASWDFQGLRLSAMGKSKKEARQKLAKDFCQKLSIKVK